MNDRAGYTEAVTEKMTRERLDIVLLVTASFPASTSPTTVCLPFILFCLTLAPLFVHSSNARPFCRLTRNRTTRLVSRNFGETIGVAGCQLESSENFSLSGILVQICRGKLPRLLFFYFINIVLRTNCLCSFSFIYFFLSSII